MTLIKFMKIFLHPRAFLHPALQVATKSVFTSSFKFGEHTCIHYQENENTSHVGFKKCRLEQRVNAKKAIYLSKDFKK